jgi:hypothetical protein
VVRLDPAGVQQQTLGDDLLQVSRLRRGQQQRYK